MNIERLMARLIGPALITLTLAGLYIAGTGAIT